MVPAPSKLETKPPGMLLTEPSKLTDPLVEFVTERAKLPEALAPANFGVPLSRARVSVPLPLVLSAPDMRKLAPSRLIDELPLKEIEPLIASELEPLPGTLPLNETEPDVGLARSSEKGVTPG